MTVCSLYYATVAEPLVVEEASADVVFCCNLFSYTEEWCQEGTLAVFSCDFLSGYTSYLTFYLSHTAFS